MGTAGGWVVGLAVIGTVALLTAGGTAAVNAPMGEKWYQGTGLGLVTALARLWGEGTAGPQGESGPGEPGIDRPATVEELIEMMNKRLGVTVQYASGDVAVHLENQRALGDTWDLGGGEVWINLMPGADRRTAFHQWLHRYHIIRGRVANEDDVIEAFLDRLRGTLQLE